MLRALDSTGCRREYWTIGKAHTVKRTPRVCDFTALYERRGKWIIATVAEVPGVNTQGRTMREARANLQEALRLVLECNRKLAEETFRPDEIVKERVRVAVGR